MTEFPLRSKYLISKMKIKSLTAVNDYLKKFEEDFYQQNQNKCLGLFLITKFSLILKEYDLKSKDYLIVEDLQQEFFKVLETFSEYYFKMFGMQIPELVESNNIMNIYDEKKKILDLKLINIGFILCLMRK